MSNLATINANNTEARNSNNAHKMHKHVGMRTSGNLVGEALNGSPRPAVEMGLVLPALVAVAGSVLVIGSALIALGIPAQFRDASCALLLILLFFGTVLLIVGVRRRCPSCRKLFAREIVGETILDSQETLRDVPRAEAALNADRMTGYIVTMEPIRVQTESYLTHCRCSHCRHEWSVPGLRQR